MNATPAGATLPGITHHRAEVNGTTLHYVAAGAGGTSILLVHGFPETWWAFRELIPLLAAHHRVYAVDLRGFGDSGNQPGEYDSATSAEDLQHSSGRTINRVVTPPKRLAAITRAQQHVSVRPADPPRQR